MKIIKKYIGVNIAGLLLVQMVTVSAAPEAPGGKIFKCTNNQGEVYYNDKPCPIEDDEKTLRSEKDVLDGYIPPSFKADKFEQRKGVVVGGGSPSQILGGSSEQISSPSETEGNGSPVSESNGPPFASDNNTTINDQQKIVRTQDIKDEGQMLSSNVKIEERGTEGKFTVQEKKLMLGISPQIK